MQQVQDLRFKDIKEINFDQRFHEDFNMILHGLLNVLQLFESHYKMCNFPNDKLIQVLLHCELIV